jgi:hypothetical protein
MKDYSTKIAVELPEAPTAEETKAAREVEQHLAGMKAARGKRVTITREAGFEKHPRAEAYRIRASDDGAELVGEGAPGALYAAYDFIERCGGWWPFDQPEGMCDVPEGASWPMGEWSSKPDFEMRHVGRTAWSVWNRTNGTSDLSCGGTSAALLLSENIAHNFKTYLDPDIYFEKHPDWFPLYDGKRHAFNEKIAGERSDVLKYSYSNQICTSNEGAVTEFAENVRRALKKRPEARFVPIGPNDGFGFCECDACRAEDSGEDDWERQLSARLIRFYNKVARALASEFPQAMFLALAYIDFTLPPQNAPDLVCEPNVGILLTHYQQCMLHPVADEHCPPNRKFAGAIEEWSKRCKNLLIYEYYRKANWWDAVWPIAQNIREDIPFYHSKKVRGFFTQYSPGHSLVNGLNYWLAARLTWDVRADSDALIRQYMEGVFGPATEPVSQVYSAFEDRFRQSGKHFPGDAHNMSLVFDEELFERAAPLLKAANGLAETPAQKWCVQALMRGIEHTRRLTRYAAAFCDWVGGEKKEYSKELKELFDEVTEPILKDPSNYRGVMNVEQLFAGGVLLDGERRRLSGERVVDWGNLRAHYREMQGK